MLVDPAAEEAMLSKRVGSVSERVQSYKFARKPSTKSARSVQVTSPAPPELDEILEHERPTSPYSELESNHLQSMHGISDDGAQLPQRVEAVEIMRDSGRATPADPSTIGSKAMKNDLKGRKNGHAYYNDAFAVREEGKKVPAAAAVWVEMKTNVIVSCTPSSLQLH